MSTSAIIGKGTTLSYATTSNGSYTALSEVTNINQPRADVPKVEATHYASENSKREYINGVWIDYGDVDLTLNYRPAQTTTINSQLGVTQWFRLIYPDGSYWQWHGFVGSFGGAIPNQGVVTQEATVRVMDTLTYTGGS